MIISAPIIVAYLENVNLVIKSARLRAKTNLCTDSRAQDESISFADA
jgi:hypothetical protein